MALVDTYKLCPCGSGRKYKWCCQPLEPMIEKAQEQIRNGQVEAALGTLQQLTKDHPENPQSFGQLASLLMQLQRGDEAEASLDQAFAVQPNYPYGLMLRGLMRNAEGETIGALILFRKAIEAYHEEAHEPLTELHLLVMEAESRLNKPLAACYAARRIRAHQPALDPRLAQELEMVAGRARFPDVARAEYPYRFPATLDAAWTAAKQTTANPDHTGAILAGFTKLSQEKPDDSDVWYNLGLVQAYRGDTNPAIDSLTKAAEKSADESLQLTCYTLIQILRFAAGQEANADHQQHYRFMNMSGDPNLLVQVLQKLASEGRLLVTSVSQETGEIAGLMMRDDGVPQLSFSTRLRRMAAHLFLSGPILQLSSPNEEEVEKIVKELQISLGMIGSQVEKRTGPISFHDLTIEALRFAPPGTSQLDSLTVRSKMLEGYQEYFEQTWANQPLKSLGNLSPMTASSNPANRPKLLAMIQLLEDSTLMALSPKIDVTDPKNRPYDFSKLKALLHLDSGSGAATGGAAGSADGAAIGRDFTTLSEAEFAALQADALADADLEAATRAAIQKAPREVADSLAKALIARPVSADRPDRYPIYQHLIQSAQNAGDTAAILPLLDQAEASDREHNSEKRQFDLAVRRAQAQSRLGDVDGAYATLSRMVAANPPEGKFYGTAAEVMIGKKQGARALEFIEKGLAAVRKKGDRDSENYLLELQDAAKRIG
ncbi:tetratricopeptide repeat protein [Tuwongella immobilis]|uniref:Tetratricopeptide repeat protein n=1 Tax=Tuwongella immobilis TaxID=692036 RepID=A0A6C2YT88_9BACT|nr:tetratricopeptide repeat protein [Tuwongella immobilis]VIP04343.1 protein disulfide-isomerase : SEC-C motif domain protein OS=Isosphaera pallida (strain ATCC 43644 / DSM 9630 / IS1B) GN=Isop_0212 PE=4 SV=1: SEC-C: TPR_19: TPR_1 [Tuwongella immobilis]VTS06048.1 protein disulfide-isomerase : SEC-C motif domain protein OS=Isosphaera pallida (strain ATCC 43644 / DSM 9630 / IS1B) GN=Isop_0212 PE=4 SV=1: SEC-C: TPR_19: TPR_1 [Tuwongella immobilis]